MYVDNRYRQQEAYFSAAHRFKPFKWWELSLATDFQALVGIRSGSDGL